MKATACGMLLAGVAAMAPAFAKVEPAKPDMRTEVLLPPIDAEMPCTRVPPGTVLSRWVTSTIRSADGTVLAVGSTEVRQRC